MSAIPVPSQLFINIDVHERHRVLPALSSCPIDYEALLSNGSHNMDSYEWCGPAFGLGGGLLSEPRVNCQDRSDDVACITLLQSEWL